MDETEFPIPASLDEALVARLDQAGAAKSVAQAASVFGRRCVVSSSPRCATCRRISCWSTLWCWWKAASLTGRLEASARPIGSTTLCCGMPPMPAWCATGAGSCTSAPRGRSPHSIRPRRRLIRRCWPCISSEGGLVEEAVPHWLEAARRSLARSALNEATRLLRRALTSLERRPATPDNIALRLQVSTLLGPALSGLTGPHSVETQEHYTKALELCRELPEDPSHFPIYWGWWRLDPFNMERATALLDRAVTRNDPELLLQAHHGNWACRLNTGSFERCCEHVEVGLSIYHQGDYRHLARSYANHDPKVCAHGSRAQAYWMQGKLNRAMDDEREALSWAHKIDYVGSRVHALGLTLLHRVYRRDYQEVFDRAGELIAFAARRCGRPRGGWVGVSGRGDSHESDPAAGLQILAEGLARQLEVATSEDFSVYLCLQAEALAAAGQADKAVEDLLRERPQFDRSGLRIWLPEVLRMTGEMIFSPILVQWRPALKAFAEATDMASAQRVPMLDLRIAMSEARLGLRSGALTRQPAASGRPLALSRSPTAPLIWLMRGKSGRGRGEARADRLAFLYHAILQRAPAVDRFGRAGTPPSG